jgi:NADH-quinone oxidoreductase subunit M
MIMITLLLVLFAAGILSWFAGRINGAIPRWISLIAALTNLVISVYIWITNFSSFSIAQTNNWILDYRAEWIPRFGISLHFAMDGLSLLMVVLTSLIGVISVLISWTEIKERIGFFHFNLMFILAGITGVFLALDLFLFYFFWEVMLIPMYFLIGIWGHENRQYAAYKFFIFTQASGLLMFLSILGLYFAHGASTGNYTFDYTELLGTSLSPGFAALLMAGFLIAFLVKVPAVPVHTWLPDAHTEAPTAGSVILAGLLLKTGAYGLLRFVIPFFPDASRDFMIPAMILGAVGILYGAKLAFAQTDLKRLVAYSSVSHMGFVLVGTFAMNELALQGVIMQIITHGISTSALFILVGALQERIHTRNIDEMGGLWEKVPRMAGIGMLFAMASLGLPGLGNFIAEFQVLAGAFRADIFWTSIAAIGLIASTIYSLKIVQRVFHGRKLKEWNLPDFNIRELFVFGTLVVSIVWLGLYPQPVLDTSRNSVLQIQNSYRIEQTETSINEEDIEKKIVREDDFTGGEE